MEWQEALNRKGLKLNANKSEVMACTRECRVEADISDNENMKVSGHRKIGRPN